ncbi:AAA family ATPase [Gimesia maris]|uniref:AAA family ATPase n=1 Tax=Gimesia maris TaxID=122 RepID=UPI003A921B63
MESTFTWIPLYRELAGLLVDWEGRQSELIACLDNLRSEGVKVTPMTDKDKDGVRFRIKELDPFTFFGSFNRKIRDEERLAILTEVKKLLGATSSLPEDFLGIPVLNNQRSWFLAYQAIRGRDDVSTLWNFFRLALSKNPLDSPEFAAGFDAALKVWGVSTNLTMGLFWVRPETFLNLDSVNRSYLDIKLPSQGLSAEFYIQTVKDIATEYRSLPDLSFTAWQAGVSNADKTNSGPSRDLPPENNYWLVGAYWNSMDPPDQTERFLAEGIWQNGYPDKYLDEVRSIKVGDRIAIKSSSTQKENLPFDARGNTVSKMSIKAVGTVVANRGDGRTIEVEWEPEFKAKDWFFFTARRTIWLMRTTEDYAHKDLTKKLIDFIWNGADQEYEWFCKRWWDSEDIPKTETDDDETSVNEPYSIEDIVAAGVFLPEEEIAQAIDRLRSKKNLILQGAPGVGKTFVARKLAYALMEEKAIDRLDMVQFHQTYSYEDFIRGYRPLPDKAGTFGLQDAIFHRFCKRAEGDPDSDFVFIIDEINRGNLGQIFGELLMLIESDKRGSEFAVPLVYQRKNEAKFFVPANVHLIGLMNLADRSLAIVDYALRRRFAFMTLAPQYSSSNFRKWLLDRQMTPDLVELVATRMIALNQEITDDPLLGENYQIGHSFFCPKGEDFSGLSRDWYEGIIQTEIVPLLKEYWFDNAKRVEQAQEGLLAK